MASATSSSAFRLDIQGLRALAVCLVIVFHIWPQLLTGGYVGVDVFFVISGYLISKHLTSEISHSGGLQLPRFWAKRIRRLLPASLCVLMASAIATYFILPAYLWEPTLEEIAASTLYVQNWMLVNNAVDYLSVDNDPTLAQHFWSLSVEEQFYLAWPLLFLAAVGLAGFASGRPFDKSNAKRAIRNLVIAILISSFAYSCYITYLRAELAYFSTASRAWQFAVGALLIFGIEQRTNVMLSVGLKVLLNWLGFGMIVASAIVFSSATAFPGYAALVPVLGTAMIIVSQTDQSPWSFNNLSRFPPVKYLGGISYSAYLWHWPLVILLPILVESSIGIDSEYLIAPMILVLTIILAGASKRWVEDPFLRKGSILSTTAGSFSGGLLGMAAVLLVCFIIFQNQPAQVKPEEGDSIMFSSVDNLQGALNATMASATWKPSDQHPSQQAQVEEWIVDNCADIDMNDPALMEHCVYGDISSTRTVAVIGDSWATHLLPAIRSAMPGWRVQVLTMHQCPIADLPVHKAGRSGPFELCVEHRRNVMEWLTKNRPELVIASESPISTSKRLLDRKADSTVEIPKALETAYRQINELGLQLIHVESPPRSNCNFEKIKSPSLCKSNAMTAKERRISERKIQVAETFKYGTIDMTSWVCTDDLICPNQIDGRLVKADGGHITNSFSSSLGHIFANELTGLGVDL